MELIEYLVTSKTRRQLLQLIWAEGLTASAHQLKSLSGASYAVTHQELTSMVACGLAKFRREGHANIYAANLNYKFSKELLGILTPLDPTLSVSRKSPLKLNRKPKNPLKLKLNGNSANEMQGNNIYAALIDLGLPIALHSITAASNPVINRKGTQKNQQITKQNFSSLPIEQVLALGIQLSKSNATVLRALSVLVIKQLQNIDIQRLLFYSRELGVVRETGFILDLTAELCTESLSRSVLKSQLKSPLILQSKLQLKNWSKMFGDNRHSKTVPYFNNQKIGKYNASLLGVNNPKIAAQWNFLVNIDLDGFQKIFQQFIRREDIK
ncbi:MAG: hypothetical protein ABL927_09050 [Bdellovibrionales bacterium]